MNPSHSVFSLLELSGSQNHRSLWNPSCWHHPDDSCRACYWGQKAQKRTASRNVGTQTDEYPPLRPPCPCTQQLMGCQPIWILDSYQRSGCFHRKSQTLYSTLYIQSIQNRVNFQTICKQITAINKQFYKKPKSPKINSVHIWTPEEVVFILVFSSLSDSSQGNQIGEVFGFQKATTWCKVHLLFGAKTLALAKMFALLSPRLFVYIHKILVNQAKWLQKIFGFEIFTARNIFKFLVSKKHETVLIRTRII